MFEGLASPWHLIILVFLFVMLFGAKRLPEMARALGQSARILKAETKGLHQGPEQTSDAAAPAGPSAAPETTDGMPQHQLTPPSQARFDIYTGQPLHPVQTTATSTGERPGSATEQPSTP